MLRRPLGFEFYLVSLLLLIVQLMASVGLVITGPFFTKFYSLQAFEQFSLPIRLMFAGLLSGGAIGLYWLTIPWILHRHQRSGSIDHPSGNLNCRDEQEQLALALEAAEMGVWSWSAETNRTTWDTRVHQLFGIEPGSFEGTQEDFFNRIHPDDREAFKREAHYDVFESPSGSFEGSYRVQLPDGSIRQICSKGRVYRDEQQRPQRMFGLNWDITQRKELERALQESQARLSDILDHATAAIVSFQVFAPDQFKYLYHSAGCEAIFGYTPQELSAEPELWASQIHPDDRAAFFQQATAAILAEQPITLEYRYYHQDGRLRWIATSLSSHRDEAHQCWVVIAVDTDISDRKQAELELQEAKEVAEAANQAKSIFLANISHELRSPLTAILGYAELFKDDARLSSVHRESFDIIYTSGKNLLDLINEILNLAKIEAGRMQLEESSFELLSLLEPLWQLFTCHTQAKGLSFELKLAPSLPHLITTDAGKLRQILTNLLSNAVKFTDYGSIILRVIPVEEVPEGEPRIPKDGTPKAKQITLCFEVEDTGLGIASEDLSRIFDAFTQAYGSQTRFEGTGLGLAISQKLTDILGGQLSVISTLGQGSCFQLRLPVKLPEPFQLPVKTVNRRVVGLAPNHPVYRILVVDDRAINRQLLLQILQKLPVEVQEAASGKAALALWQQWRPHLVWLDLRMPDMDGLEVVRQIRAKECRLQEDSEAQSQSAPPSHTIVIALTAQAYSTDREQALAAGCDDFVTKPFQELTLFEKMAKHLGLDFIYTTDALPLSSEFQNQPVLEELTTLSESLRQVMPSDWIEDLYKAALNCNAERVNNLLQQIPLECTTLIRRLNHLAYNFQFDLLMKLLHD